MWQVYWEESIIPRPRNIWLDISNFNFEFILDVSLCFATFVEAEENIDLHIFNSQSLDLQLLDRLFQIFTNEHTM